MASRMTSQIGGASLLEAVGFAEALYAVWRPGPPQMPASRGQTERAYEHIWKQLVNHQLEPGDRVLDAEIAAQLGMSRTPVREAIQRLIQDGFLEPMARGVRVTRLTAREVVELYDYRTALESFAARRAAGVISEEALHRLQHQTKELQRRFSQPEALIDAPLAADYLRHEIRLHQTVMAAAPNRYMAQAMASIRGRLAVFGVASLRIPGRIAQTFEEHSAIVEALVSRSGDAAASAMERHIQQAKQRVLADFFWVKEPLGMT